MRQRMIRLRSLSRALASLLLPACSDSATDPGSDRRTGAIRVTVTMTGADIPTQYSINAGGRSTGANRDLPATISGLFPGEHTVLLRVTANCEADGENPRRVTVVAGETTPVGFSVSCAAATGVLRVTSTTTGIDIDADGYAARVEGFSLTGTAYEQTRSLAATGVAILTGVPAGNKKVSLTGMAANCDPTDANPRTVTVVAAETLTVAFEVECGADALQIAYVTAAPGGTGDIRLVAANGTNDRPLTTGPSLEEDPAWSADGRRIVFTSDRDGNREIYAIDADGTNLTRLTNSPGAEYHPAWSRDGERIAFVSERDGNPEIYVMDPDGTSLVRLTTNDADDVEPAWVPTGQRLAFTSDRDGAAEIYVMNADGSEPTRVTSGGGRYPAWSPDGRTLAYAGQRCPSYPFACHPAILFVPGPISPGSDFLAIGSRPTWSPDGRKLAYENFQCDFYFAQCEPVGIVVARFDGTGTIATINGRSPAWRP